jgi:hypothetical protein
MHLAISFEEFNYANGICSLGSSVAYTLRGWYTDHKTEVTTKQKALWNKDFVTILFDDKPCIEYYGYEIREEKGMKIFLLWNPKESIKVVSVTKQLVAA